jgi:hypothetical protein
MLDPPNPGTGVSALAYSRLGPEACLPSPAQPAHGVSAAGSGRGEDHSHHAMEGVVQLGVGPTAGSDRDHAPEHARQGAACATVAAAHAQVLRVKAAVAASASTIARGVRKLRCCL